MSSDNKSINRFIAVALFLSLISLAFLPIMDPSEGRYAQIGKDMLAKGDYVTPWIWMHGKLIPFWGKPPLCFWLETLSMKCFGVNAFAARLPSALSGFLLVLLLYTVLKRYRGRDTALSAAAILFTCGGLFFTAGLALIDTLLTFFSSGAWILYYAFLQEHDKRLKKLFSLSVFAMLALGFLTKGPVALAMFGIPVFLWTLLNKQWATLKYHAWFLGIPLFLLITVPWFWLAEIKTPGFLNYFFIHENLLRFIKHNYGDLYGSGHKFPHGMAIPFLLLATLPWSLVLAIIAAISFGKRQKGAASWVRGKLSQLISPPESSNEKYDYFAIALISIPLFWCFARQLLVYYLLPALPAFAVYVATVLNRHGFDHKRIVKTSTALVISYVITLGVLSFTLGKRKSTRGVIAQVVSSPAFEKGKTKIVLVRSVPYSAYFYGGDLIIPHPKENTNKSLERGLDNENYIYIVKRRHFDRINPKLKKRFDIVRHSTGWYILIPKGDK